MANLAPAFDTQFFDGQTVAAGYKLYTYASGTTTPKATYTDQAGVVPHMNPITLDADGKVPGQLWLEGGEYTLALYTDEIGDGGALVDTWNDVGGVGDSGIRPDLADDSSASKGAGMVVVGAGISYANGTVGARLNRAWHPSNTNVILGPTTGDDSALAGTIGYRNTFVGASSGAAIGAATTAGGSNAGFGFAALNQIQNGSGNCGFGAFAGYGWTNNNHNNAFGYQSQNANASGTQNNSFGFRALYNLAAGDNNTAIGESSLYTMTNGGGHTFVGAFSGYSRTGGNYCTGVGLQTQFTATSAEGNTSLGYKALFGGNNSYNTAVGTEANTNGGGNYNSSFGYQAHLRLTTGQYNCAFGWAALFDQTTGDSNTGIGQQAGRNVTTGSANTFVGANTGIGILAGSDNTIVGASAQASGDYTNCTVLGNGASATGSNQVVLGDSSIAVIRAQVTTITALSDRRDKKNIKPLPLGLDFINGVEIVEFQRDQRDWYENGQPDGSNLAPREAGVIAQQLKELQEHHGAEWLGLVLELTPDRLEATPGKLLFPLIKAVQELAAENAAMRTRLDALENP